MDWYIDNIGKDFNEDYLSMSESELRESYLLHIEGLATSYDESHEMNIARHLTILTLIIDLVEDKDAIVEVERRWKNDNPERIETFDEVYDIFFE